MSDQPWRRYWVVPAFVGLLLAPAPWAAALVVAAAVGVTALRIARAARARRADASARRDAAVTLGHDPRGRSVALSDHELSAHGLILGASGAGKSTTLLKILTDEIARGRPVVAIDMKGSPAFAQALGEAARAAGRPFAVWSIDGPAHWNPLQHGNATELKDKLMATERFTEPHYQRAAERYVQMVLQILAAAHPGRAAVLGEVVQMMDPARLPSMLRGVDPELRDRVRDYLAGLTPDQLSAVRGLQTRLAVLTESHTARYLAPAGGGAVVACADATAGGAVVGGARATAGGADATIDVREALRGPQVVLFSLNSARYGRLAAQLGTLAVQDLVSASGERLGDAGPGGGLLPATIAIDEFSALGADHVIALLSRGRESGLSVLVATQEMADLDRAAPWATRPGRRRDRAQDRAPSGGAAVRAHDRANDRHRAGVGDDETDRRPAVRWIRHRPGHAPRGRALHRAPERDPVARHRTGDRHLQAGRSQGAEGAGRTAAPRRALDPARLCRALAPARRAAQGRATTNGTAAAGRSIAPDEALAQLPPAAACAAAATLAPPADRLTGPLSAARPRKRIRAARPRASQSSAARRPGRRPRRPPPPHACSRRA